MRSSRFDEMWRRVRNATSPVLDANGRVTPTASNRADARAVARGFCRMLGRGKIRRRRHQSTGAPYSQARRHHGPAAAPAARGAAAALAAGLDPVKAADAAASQTTATVRARSVTAEPPDPSPRALVSALHAPHGPTVAGVTPVAA